MSDIRELEVSIEEAKAKVELGEALIRLRKNRDFKKIFMDGFFDAELKAMTYLMATPMVETSKAGVTNVLVGISATQQYMDKIAREAYQAEHAIAACEAELAEARQEDME